MTYEELRAWEMENGESYLDQNSPVSIRFFLGWFCATYPGLAEKAVSLFKSTAPYTEINSFTELVEANMSYFTIPDDMLDMDTFSQSQCILLEIVSRIALISPHLSDQFRKDLTDE